MEIIHASSLVQMQGVETLRYNNIFQRFLNGIYAIANHCFDISFQKRITLRIFKCLPPHKPRIGRTVHRHPPAWLAFK